MTTRSVRRRYVGETRSALRHAGVRAVRIWNRRLHFYVGLYFLLFIWLFSISGLLLNHSQWSVAQFWDKREESSSVLEIRALSATADEAIAHELSQQLGVVGEVGRIERAENGRFRLQVNRPGRTLQIEADLAARSASVKEITVNAAGVLDALHRFTGVRVDDPKEQRDWLLTGLWSFAMDALAVGLGIMVLSGVYMWFRLRKNRRAGLVALSAGVVSCGFFVIGLTTLF
ncbi:MAG: PepSY-associated TM helix domain-containing protein [Gemmatimonadota bacterium]